MAKKKIKKAKRNTEILDRQPLKSKVYYAMIQIYIDKHRI